MGIKKIILADLTSKNDFCWCKPNVVYYKLVIIIYFALVILNNAS